LNLFYYFGIFGILKKIKLNVLINIFNFIIKLLMFGKILGAVVNIGIQANL